MKTLIVYASKYGCTETCVKQLAGQMTGDTDLLSLKEKKDGIDLQDYDAVIIGGSVYVGKIQKEVPEFCTRHLETLLQKRIGLFICGMQEEAVLQQELQQSFPEELLSVAIAKDHFGGAFNLEKMNLMERVIVKKVSKVTTNVTSIAEDRIAAFAAAMVQAKN
ncbi:MAG: flavodoxin [Firmicutes bacterium HGW-Firmicutes-11]|jgi:menaquinone-dependent protoporphyrinogen oxidase|nr:MAG: flavodoxin [Firmicutes bacterium HGW-Firmicutes-11]